MTKRTEQYAVRFEPELLDAARAAAEQERRSLANWIRNAVQDQLRSHQHKPGAAA